MRWSASRCARLAGLLVVTSLVFIVIKIGWINMSSDTSERLEFSKNTSRYRRQLWRIVHSNDSEMNQILGVDMQRNHSNNNAEASASLSNKDSHNCLHSPMSHLSHLERISYVAQPALRISTGRIASLVIGIPTIKREHADYLIPTLRTLLDNMDELEKSLVVIVVLIAQPDDPEFIANVSRSVQEIFSQETKSGLIEVAAPPREFYPNLTALAEKPNRFKDNPERFKWRVKQNLDYAFLMAYCNSKGKYYLQLEDDVLAEDGFIARILCDIVDKNSVDWLQMQYSELGFIGKLFRSDDLPQLVEFILTFHEEKPVDWVLFDYMYVKACEPGEKRSVCNKKINAMDLHYPQKLFTHIGKFSSLGGKTHKMSKSERGKPGNAAFLGFTNPPANLKTSLASYKSYRLDRAYSGFSIFWAEHPKPNDFILIEFKQEFNLSTYFFLSGDADHPHDIIRNATLLGKFKHFPADLPLTEDGSVVLANFETEGVCRGTVPPDYGPALSLQIVFKVQSPNWIILNEIMLSPQTTNTTTSHPTS